MKIAICTALYNAISHLPGLFASLEKLEYPQGQVEIIMVDNASVDGTRAWIEKNVLPRSGKELPTCHFIWSEKNSGYAGGNNACIKLALDHGCDAVYLLNDDAFGEPGFLNEAVAVMEGDERIAAVQSFLMLSPGERGANSIGNCVHYLGFGYCDGYRMSRADAEGLMRTRAQKDSGLPIGYASGAAVLLRAVSLGKIGLLAEEYFMYHEDLDLSFRLREAGYMVTIAPKSVVHHSYEFKKSSAKFYWIERNRLRFLIEHYKLPTLLLLVPMGIVIELGLIAYSIKNGLFYDRLRIYAYMLNPMHWPGIWRRRHAIQRARTISDRELLQYTVSRIEFQDVRTPALRFINPILAAYGALMRRIIRW